MIANCQMGKATQSCSYIEVWLVRLACRIYHTTQGTVKLHLAGCWQIDSWLEESTKTHSRQSTAVHTCMCASRLNTYEIENTCRFVIDSMRKHVRLSNRSVITCNIYCVFFFILLIVSFI